MKDIAHRCGVSIATVSKALNGQLDIGEETRGRILRTAEEMGYMTNAAARALKTKRTYNLGVLFVDPMHGGLAHEFFSTVLDGIRSEAERSNYDITFINNLGSRASTYLQHCRYRGVNSELPVVTIDHVFNNHIAVVSDNTRGMEELVRFAASRGHRRLALIHGEKTTVTLNRLAGFYRACEALDIPVRDEWVREGVFHDPQGCCRITKELLAQPEKPTCVFFPDDYSYIGGLNAVTEAGLRIPEDISAVGYDGIPLSRIVSPVLTTWRQDTAGMGAAAASGLIGLIEHPRTAILDRVVISGSLQEGGSVRQLTDS